MASGITGRATAILWGVFLAITLVPSRSQAATPRPVWVKRIGGYRLVKWNRPATNREEDDTESILIFDGRDREVARVTSVKVDLKRGGDFTGRGSPCVVIQAEELGWHNRRFYYVFSLGRWPRCLLADFKDDYDDDPHQPDFAVRDLNVDGRREIVSWYDGFAYWDPGRGWSCSYNGAVRVPVVLGIRHGRYVDVTAQFPARLQRRLTEARVSLKKELSRAHEKLLVGDAAQPIVECYCLKLLLSGPARARRLIEELVPKADTAHFRMVELVVREIMRDRSLRYAHPRLYRRDYHFNTEKWEARG